MVKRHKYTAEELEQYLERICVPKNDRTLDVSTLDEPAKLKYLQLLAKHQLVKVPWENFTQHYSWHRVVNVKPRHLFTKIVHSPARGGYCMEANYFFHLILHSLGFAAHMAGSRIYNGPENGYGGWSHVVNIATIDGQRYMLDGGYGAQGPTRPILLEPGAVSTQIAPSESRLLHEAIEENADRSNKVWLYQHRFTPESEWTTRYCFSDLEFLPGDIEGMNLAPWQSPHTFFTHKVVACRFTTDRERENEAEDDVPGSPDEAAVALGEIDGSMTLAHDVVKWRRRGRKVAEVRLGTEVERLAGIRKYFGITFSEADAEGIRGTAASIVTGSSLADVM